MICANCQCYILISNTANTEDKTEISPQDSLRTSSSDQTDHGSRVADPMKVVHKEQDVIAAFSSNQVTLPAALKSRPCTCFCNRLCSVNCRQSCLLLLITIFNMSVFIYLLSVLQPL